MPKFIARFIRPLRNVLFPPGGESGPDGGPDAVAFRPSVVFVHACHSGLTNRHSALLLPYPRAEFERWERARQRLVLWNAEAAA
ncbi:hypothetical protein OG596_24720 [Streptomyces sp. NBC_01102]|uniref:hypothetical protein n=1 Tax=unclassified Streptomyces TaxID=2593676 RepID=UPI00386F96B3|nr:hypothetical protein OG596_24720 [Streptomyces sp. NBC_01102]